MSFLRQLVKNPVFYYILAPALTALWPLLVWGVYLPRAKQALGAELDHARQGQNHALKILQLDPGRLASVDANDTAPEFSYAVAVDKVADLCTIPASKYTLSTGPVIERKGQKTQTAHLKIDKVSSVQFAQFLSIIQVRFGGLQCEQIKLKKIEGLPDTWTVDMDFKYSF